jgi:signal transduction histidine kinase
LLDEARVKGLVYFTDEGREAVAYHYTDNNVRMVIVVSGEDEEGKDYLHHLATNLLFSFLGGVVVAITGGYFFSKGLVLPLKKIADDVAEISAQNLTRRIQVGHSHDEWRYLSQTLNELLNRLQESFDLQKRFIANASHELSTPLTSISSQLEVALQRERAADDYKIVMQSIYQDVRQMSKLTQTLLEFAKASGMPGGINLNPVRVDELLLQLPAEMAKTDKGYAVTLEFEELPADEHQLLVFGNEELLFTALKNITVNACKYSDDHKATLLLLVSDAEIKIVIKDKGKGIPAHEIEHIFEPFYRVDESLSTKGFGLGLSLAYRIIKLHQGTITIDSVTGVGTSFIISLPPAAHANKA